MEQGSPEQENEPDFLRILTTEDREKYKQLRNRFCNYGHDLNQISNFDDIISAIKDFSVRGDELDGARANVCGICQLNNGIAVNPQHLSYMIGNSKNTIDYAFNKLNYQNAPQTAELLEKMPQLRGNVRELRMWSVKKLCDQTPAPKINMSRKVIIQQKSLSPLPPLQAAGIFKNQWSYEDYREAEQNQDQGQDQTFFDDPFSIPLNMWNDDEMPQ